MCGEKIKKENHSYLYTNYEFISKIIDVPKYEVEDSIRSGFTTMYFKLCYTHIWDIYDYDLKKNGYSIMFDYTEIKEFMFNNKKYYIGS